MHVGPCGAQTLKVQRNYARGRLWCTTPKIGVEIVRMWFCSAQLSEMAQSYKHLGLGCTTHKTNAKLHTCWIMVHNSKIMYKVLHE